MKIKKNIFYYLGAIVAGSVFSILFLNNMRSIEINSYEYNHVTKSSFITNTDNQAVKSGILLSLKEEDLIRLQNKIPDFEKNTYSKSKEKDWGENINYYYFKECETIPLNHRRNTNNIHRMYDKNDLMKNASNKGHIIVGIDNISEEEKNNSVFGVFSQKLFVKSCNGIEFNLMTMGDLILDYNLLKEIHQKNKEYNNEDVNVISKKLVRG